MIRWIAIAGALLLTVASSAQLAETFVGDWTTSFGTLVNRVAADPNDPQQFYGLLDARKLQAEVENYSVVVKYDCRGQFAWTRALEGGDSTRQLIDMEVHSGNGKIGVLHADDSRFILQWLRPGGTPIGNVEVDRNPNWNPLDLAADPNRPRWYILYRDNTGVLGHFALMVIDEMGGLQQTWQSDRVAFGKAQLEVLPSGELLLAANGRMYRINAGTGQVEGWSWAGDDPLNIDFSAWESDAYFAEWTDSGLRISRWTSAGPQQVWVGATDLFPADAFNLQIAANANTWAIMADLSIGGGAPPIGLLQGQRNTDFSSLLTPDVFAANGHIALDADDRILYSGSTSGGSDDHLFRLDADNPCVEVTTPGATLENGDLSLFSPIPVFNLQSLSPDWRETDIALFTDIPPEDRRCQSFISRDDLAEVFRDTLAECVDSLVWEHPFSEGVEWNGEPIPQPWVIRAAGSYTVSAPVCQRAETFTFSVEFTDCDCAWAMPNIFSPNGDGINDEFGPAGSCVVRSYELQIFDRWGQLVFESRDPNIAWDGRRRNSPLPIGVYVYRWVYQPLTAPEPIQQNGTVTLVR
jgi:gliding motility-associated-like protein